MKSKVVWTNKARYNLLSVLDFWADKNKSNAYPLKIKNEIRKIESILGLNPKIGVLRIYKGRRVRVLHLLRKFTILYFIEDDHTVKVVGFISSYFNREGFS